MRLSQLPARALDLRRRRAIGEPDGDGVSDGEWRRQLDLVLPATTPTLTAVSCSDVTHCAAVGEEQPCIRRTGWQSARRPASEQHRQPRGGGLHHLNHLHRRRAGEATMGGLLGSSCSPPTGVRPGQLPPIRGTPALDALSCPSTTFCVAVGEAILVSDDGGSTWQARGADHGFQTLTSVPAPVPPNASPSGTVLRASLTPALQARRP